MKITDIKPNPGNPRLIKDDKFKRLCRSISEFPQMMALRPIIVDADGVILGGNMRYQALKHLGFTELQEGWVKRASDLTDEQKREFIIKDNVGFGEWDFDMLANEWDQEALADWGLDVPVLVGCEDYDFSALDEENSELDGEQDATITITVPEKHKTAILAWLADGESTSSVGLGKGLMKRCGLR